MTMWAPEQMAYVELGALESDARPLLEELGRLGAIELADARPLGGAVPLPALEPGDRIAQLRNLARRADQAAGMLRGDLDAPPPGRLADRATPVAPADCIESLEAIERRAQALRERADREQERLGAAGAATALARRLADLAPLTGDHARGLVLRIGCLPRRELAAVRAALPSGSLVRVYDDGSEPLVVAAAARSRAGLMDELLRAHRFSAEPPERLMSAAEAADAERRARAGAVQAESELRAVRTGLIVRLAALRYRFERDAELATAAQLVGSRGRAVVVAGWLPRRRIGEVREALRAALRAPATIQESDPGALVPPTVLRNPRPLTGFQRLIENYGAIPHRDLDVTPAVGVTFTLMFGAMFPDTGHGILLLLAGLLLALRPPHAIAGLRGLGPVLALAGLAASVSGVLFGEFFGPSGLLGDGVVHALDQPEELLAAGAATGAVLILASLAASIANRLREGRAREALTDVGAGAGLALYAGLLLAAAGLALGGGGVFVAGLGGVALGLAALTCGEVPAGRRSGAAVLGSVLAQTVEGSIRLASNTLSFARLGAFALAHVTLSLSLFDLARAAHGSPVVVVLAGALFVIGTALAVMLEGLVVAIQALRLHYYELFGRLYPRSGRVFRPFRLDPAVGTNRGGSP